MKDFEFQIVVTEKCNLACTYCYMKPGARDMPLSRFKQHLYMLHNTILPMYKKDSYKAVFFGGEPLVNWRTVRDSIPILKADPKCTSITLITNGLILDNKFILDYLDKYGVHISLSFDGLWNKNNRVYAKDGSSSFGDYVKFKNLLQQRGCKVMITPSSVESLVGNYKWFIQFGVLDPDFSLVRDAIWNSHDIDLYKQEIVKFADQVIAYNKEGISTFPGLFNLYALDMLAGRRYGKRAFGCFAGHCGAGFMPNGKVYPCARYGNKDIGELFNSVNNSVNKDNLKLYTDPKYYNPQTYEKCQKCDLYIYCNAGCHFSQRGVPIDSICQLYHSTYNETIRIIAELKNNATFKKRIKKSIERLI